jgi:iron-sulfur cluster assembly accessory protein
MNTNVETAPESVVQLTPNAVEEVKWLLQRPENTGKTLRLSVEQGGCSGMSYAMAFETPRPGDFTAEAGDVPVRVDPASIEYLQGAVVDFTRTLIGGGFKVTNPNAKHSCGCGKSFTA